MFRDLLPGFLLVGLLVVAASAAGHSLEPQVSPDNRIERCRAIQDDAVRLRCYEDASVAGPSQARGAAAGTWRLVRTPNPAGGRDAVSIMQTADMSRSDLDLAGLMIRCGETATEVLVVLVQPLPPRAQPTVTVGAGATSERFTSRVVPPGALILLPPEATVLARGPWQAASELTVVVADQQVTSRGVIPLGGLRAALDVLRSNCPSQ